MHKYLRYQLIFNLHHEQLISVITENNIGYIYLLIQVEYLVIQNAPQEQVFVYILKDYFSATFVGIEFMDWGFKSLL